MRERLFAPAGSTCVADGGGHDRDGWADDNGGETDYNAGGSHAEELIRDYTTYASALRGATTTCQQSMDDLIISSGVSTYRQPKQLGVPDVLGRTARLRARPE